MANDIISLFLSIGVVGIVLIFATVMQAEVYKETEADVNSIADATIKASAQNSIANTFEAMDKGSGYLPLIILGIVIATILGLILGLGSMGGTRANTLVWINETKK